MPEPGVGDKLLRPDVAARITLQHYLYNGMLMAPLVELHSTTQDISPGKAHLTRKALLSGCGKVQHFVCGGPLAELLWLLQVNCASADQPQVVLQSVACVEPDVEP